MPVATNSHGMPNSAETAAAKAFTPEARVPAIAANRVLFRDGVPIAALEGGTVRRLAESELPEETLQTLFWRRSSDLKLRVPAISRGAVRQRLLHGGAGVDKGKSTV